MRDAGGFGEVVTDDAQVGLAPKVVGRRGIGGVRRREQRRARKHEAAHRRDRAAEGDEHALEAGEHTLAAGAVLADDNGGRFAEPKRGALGRGGVFEECLQDAAPRIPVRAGADEETVGARESGGELRAEAGADAQAGVEC